MDKKNFNLLFSPGIDPPTRKQTNKVLKQLSADDDAFWIITAPNHPFPIAETFESFTHSQTRRLLRNIH